jgi:hypothetical protein
MFFSGRYFTGVLSPAVPDAIGAAVQINEIPVVYHYFGIVDSNQVTIGG